MRCVFRPAAADEDASKRAVVVFPSPVAEDVTCTILGGLSTLIILMPLRSARPASLKLEVGFMRISRGRVFLPPSIFVSSLHSMN